jgi:poly(A) polymerase
MIKMTARTPYEILLDDPVWGHEIRTLVSQPECESSMPVVVGGAVRDLLLGRKIKDLDISVAHPDTARGLATSFAEKTNRRLVEYSHEQTIFRVTGADQPQVDFTDPVGGTRESDLIRRDFTINAMAVGLIGNEKGILFDPTGGQNDLEKIIIRATAPEVFDDDPLRLLRAFRFAAHLKFAIDPGTLEEIKIRAIKLRDVAGERIQLELCATLDPDGADEIILLMDDHGIIRTLFPELSMQKGVLQNAYHHLDVWEHTIDSVRKIEKILRLEDPALEPYADKLNEYIGLEYPSGHSRRSLIKLGMLLHDIAKPHCRAIRDDDGRITFIGHERRGADFVRDYFTHYKFPGYERDYVCALVEGHLRPGFLIPKNTERPKVAYRFFRDYEDAAVGIILVSLADRLAAQGEMVTEEINERHRKAADYLLDSLYNRTELVVRPPQLIDGGTIMHELRIPPGPMIGHLLRRVAEAQVMGEVKTKEEALEYCRGIVGEEGD